MMLNLLSDSKSDTKKQKLSFQIIQYLVLTFTNLRTSPRGGAVPGAPETNNKVPMRFFQTMEYNDSNSLKIIELELTVCLNLQSID